MPCKFFPFLFVHLIQSRLLRVAVLPPSELQEDSANCSIGVKPLHFRNTSARMLDHAAPMAKQHSPRDNRALVQWPFNIQTQHCILCFKDVLQVAVPSAASFSRNTADKPVPSLTEPVLGSLALFRTYPDLKLLEAPQTVLSRALVFVGNRAAVGCQATSNWTKHPFPMKYQPLSRTRRFPDSSIHFVSESTSRSAGDTYSTALDQPVVKQEQPTHRGSKIGSEESFQSGSSRTQWLCSCVLVQSNRTDPFQTFSPSDSCGSHEEHSQALTVHSHSKAFAPLQQKAAARMYKQARQLLLMKQMVKKTSEINLLNRVGKKDAKVTVDESGPLAELNHVLKIREDAHTEHCNLLAAVVTLVVLLAVSRQTVKLPEDCRPAWSEGIEILPLHTTLPNPSQEESALQLPVNESKDELPERPVLEAEHAGEPPECKGMLEDGVSQCDDTEHHHDGNEQHAVEVTSCLQNSVQTEHVDSCGEAQDDGSAQLPDVYESRTTDGKVEKFDDQDEVSSCVSSCGTSDGYEKLEIGGSIFMDEEENDE